MSQLTAAVAALCLPPSPALAQGRQAHRSADRAYRLYGRPARHRGRQAGAEEIEEQGSARLRRGHGEGPHRGEQAGAGAGQEAEGHAARTIATSQALTKQAAAKRAELAKLNGAAFDKAYVDNEVAYHKTVNGALETTLIPSASNAELKSLLQTGLKIFQGHEQHAEHVDAALK